MESKCGRAAEESPGQSTCGLPWWFCSKSPVAVGAVDWLDPGRTKWDKMPGASGLSTGFLRTVSRCNWAKLGVLQVEPALGRARSGPQRLDLEMEPLRPPAVPSLIVPCARDIPSWIPSQSVFVPYLTQYCIT